MFAIVDKRSPEKSIQNLSKYVSDIFLFETFNTTYNSISGHPDIFIYQQNNTLIIAPNSPKEFINFLNSKNIKFEFGKSFIGNDLENCSNYNCVSSEKYFFHNLKFTDEKILELNKNKIQINLNQAYTACSLLVLPDNTFVTSDKGIFKVLENNNLNVSYFSPEKIKIFDHKNGFFGGTCGFVEKKLFFNGNVDLHENGKIIRNLTEKLEIEIVNLNDVYLYDGGKIFFV